MNKSDIKTGMFGMMKNNGNFVVVDDRIVYENGGYDYIVIMNDDLRWRYDQLELLFDANVVKSFGGLKDSIRSGKCNAIYWRERDSKSVEMTISEIKSKLGIKNLKIIEEDK